MLCSFSTSAFSLVPEPLLGVWGTEAQCARALIIPTGTKRFEPFDIRPDWLGHGEIWCRLTGVTVSATSPGLYSNARARCGEDIDRDYEINFHLVEDQLTVTWDRNLVNGPLKRCTD